MGDVTSRGDALSAIWGVLLAQCVVWDLILIGIKVNCDVILEIIDDDRWIGHCNGGLCL